MKSSQIENKNAGFDYRGPNFGFPHSTHPQHIISILKHKIAVQKAIDMIKTRMQDPPTLGDLATFTGLSRTYFSHVFKEVTGMRLQDYFAQVRLERAKDLLGNIDLKIKKIAYESAFADPNYFCQFFKKKMGLNPTRWRLKILLPNKKRPLTDRMTLSNFQRSEKPKYPTQGRRN